MARDKYHPNRVWNTFGEEFFAPYLEVLEKTGLYIRAADAVGCRPIDCEFYRKDHPEFEELVQEALERFRAGIVEEAHRRAVIGVEKPIIGGRNRDEIVAKEVVHSDRLMELFLKRGKSEDFRDKQEVTLNQGDWRSEMDLRSLSTRARAKLRELLEIINEDDAARQLGQVVE